MEKVKKVLLESESVNLKLNTILDKFFNSDFSKADIIMSGYNGNPIVDENFYHHVDSEMKRLYGGIKPEDNPDRIKGVNYRELLYGLFMEIHLALHNLIEIDETIVTARYVCRSGSGYEYDLTIGAILI